MLPSVTKVHEAIDEIKELGVQGCTFGEHRIRVVGRRIERGLTNDSSKIHKAVAYTTDVFNANKSFRERILFRVEFLAGKSIFLAASSSRGPIQEQVKVHEQVGFLGGPFNWIYYKDPLKTHGLTNIQPLDFLDIVQSYMIDVARELSERPSFTPSDFVKELWQKRLGLKEARQMYDKVKYVKDWGDLTAHVVVDISFSSSKLEARLREAIDELDTAVPSRGRDPAAPVPQTAGLPQAVIDRTRSLSRSGSFAVPLAFGLSRQTSFANSVASSSPGDNVSHVEAPHSLQSLAKPRGMPPRSQTMRRATIADVPDAGIVAAAKAAHAARTSSQGPQPPVQQGYNGSGQQQGYDQSGQQQQGYDQSGQQQQGYDQSGQQQQQGYDQSGQYQQGYDQSGQYQQGYNQSGQQQQGYDQSGQYQEGYDQSGQYQQEYDQSGQYQQQGNYWGQSGGSIPEEQPVQYGR